MNNSSYLGLAFWLQDRQPVQRADWTSTKKKNNKKLGWLSFNNFVLLCYDFEDN